MAAKKRKRLSRPHAAQPRPRPRGSKGRGQVDQATWEKADAEISEMVDTFAEMGADLLTEEDPFFREVRAAWSLTHLTDKMWQRHPKALSGVVAKLAAHPNPGGHALVMVGSVFLRGKLGDLLREANMAVVRANVHIAPKWALTVFDRAHTARYFLLKPDGRDDELSIVCLFERNGFEFGWMVGLDPNDCGAACLFEPIPHDLMGNVKDGLLKGTFAGGGFTLEEMSVDQGRWMTESALRVLEAHQFKVSDEQTEFLNEHHDVKPENLPAFSALVRWHVFGAKHHLTRKLPKHGGHLPFRKWED